MECVEGGNGKIIMFKDILGLSDVPKYKGHKTMLKHFRDFETHLSQHYGAKGFPFDYMV